MACRRAYFHNGDARTLREVVELYSRGGNVFPVQALDGTAIEPLGIPVLTSDEIDAIVAFSGNAHRRAGPLSARAVRSPADIRAERTSGRIELLDRCKR